MVYVWMGDETNPIETSHQISSLQFIPKYIGIYLGRSQDQYPGFEGDIEQWYFVYGEGTWENPDYASCENNDYCDIASLKETCVTLYSECNYEGTKSVICNDTPFTDVDYEVKSILLPEDETVWLYNMPCFQGETAEISASIDCLG